MKDVDCVRFLQWALPQMQLRWPGFRKVRKQVCKRIAKRLAELALPDIDAYRDFLLRQPAEWIILDRFCRITISRFYRDKRVFSLLARELLPALAARALTNRTATIRAWSIGCCSGEEPYTLAILWQASIAAQFPGVRFSILATDTNPRLLERCYRACYPYGAIKNLPDGMRTAAFNRTAGEYCLKPQYKAGVEFAQQDIRKTLPAACFDLILCRNLVFTYFADHLQRRLLHDVYCHLNRGGWLLAGAHEKLPDEGNAFRAVAECPGLYQKQPVTV